MTWGELKARAEALGVQDGDEVGAINLDDEGRILFSLDGERSAPEYHALGRKSFHAVMRLDLPRVLRGERDGETRTKG